MDFIEGLPRSYGYNSVLVVVDRFCKYSHFILLSHLFTSKVVATELLAQMVKLHGFPSSIVTGRDWVRAFSSPTNTTQKKYHIPPTNRWPK